MDEEKQNKDKGINLLPAELQRKQKVIRQIIARSEMEYTTGDAADGKKTSTKSQLKKTDKKPSFFSTFFSFLKSKKEEKKELPTASVQKKAPMMPVEQKVAVAPPVHQEKIAEAIIREAPAIQKKAEERQRDATLVAEPKAAKDLPEGKHLPSGLFSGIKDKRPDAKQQYAPAPVPTDQKKSAAPIVPEKKPETAKTVASSSKRSFAQILKSIFFRPAKQKVKQNNDTKKKISEREDLVHTALRQTPPSLPEISAAALPKEKEPVKKPTLKKETEPKKSIWSRIATLFKREKTAKPAEAPEKKITPPKEQPILPRIKTPAPSVPLPTPEIKIQPQAPKAEPLKQQTVEPEKERVSVKSSHDEKFMKEVATDFVRAEKEEGVDREKQDGGEFQKQHHTMADALNAWHKKGSTEAPPHTPSGFEVNLLTKEYAEIFSPKNRIATLVWSSVFAFLLVALVYVSIHLYEVRNRAGLAAATSVIQNMEQAIASYSELQNEDNDLRAKVDAIGSLLDSHISIESFLHRIEEITIPEVTYTSIALSNNGTVVLSALAKDYTSLARQLTVFENEAPWIDKVIVTSASLERDDQSQVSGVNFDIIVVVSKDVFTQQY